MTAKQPSEAAQSGEDSLLEEAAIWQARLREPAGETLTAERDAAFRAWLATDPRHAQAYAEAGRLWRALELPIAELLAEDARDAAAEDPVVTLPRRSARRLLPRIVALAACLLIAVGAGRLFYQDALDAWRSDRVTAIGERLPEVLADGSRIVLNTDTAVALNLDGAERHVELFRGEAWFEVASDPARPFVVETPLGAVRVTGTKFDVRVEEDSAIVSLVEGRVELTPVQAARSAPVALAPGEQAKITAAGISPPVPFDATAVTAWVRGQFVFYDTPLAEVIAELNRYRAGRIVIAGSDLEALKVSGVFRTDDPDAALGVISDTLGVEVTRLTDYLVLLH